MLKIPIVKINEFITVPAYATVGSAGMDLQAAHSGCIKVGERQLIKTGIMIALPQNYEAQIRPRSGIAYKHGVTLINSPGTIDSDYRGEIMLPLINLGASVFRFIAGDRLAQMIIAKYEQVEFEVVETLKETQRGAGGFGHTEI